MDETETKYKDGGFKRQLRLYLDPFALARNVEVNDGGRRASAQAANRSLRKYMPTYGLRWSVIGGLSTVGMYVAEGGMRLVGTEWLLPLVASGIGVAVSSVVVMTVIVAWFWLGRP